MSRRSYAAGPGSAALVWLRELKGLTQAKLAAQSGVSVRTIRMLERGEIEVPRGDTLDSIALGAGLTSAEAASFRRAWSRKGRFATFTQLAANGADVEAILAEAAIGAAAEVRIVTLSERCIVGPTRRVQEIVCEQLIETMVEGADSMCILARTDQSSDGRLERLETLSGCELLDVLRMPEHHLVAYRLGLGAPMVRGATRLMRFRRVAATTRPDEPQLGSIFDGLLDSDGLTAGSRRPMDHLQVEISFVGEQPTTVWPIESRVGFEGYHRGPALALDPFGSVHVVHRDVAPGSYGLEWAWSDRA